MTEPQKLRLGAVNYLNTKPLVYQLDALAPDVEIVYDLPSRLADQLAERQLDVALIPSIELFFDPTYRVVSDACIACRGPVLSVKMFSRVPIEQIRRLALDEGSRTSAALVQILLDQRHSVRPELCPLPIGANLESVEADAVLLIGDRAIHSPAGRYQEVWDLGDQWWRWTGLPFVFAMWVTRDAVSLGTLATALAEARDQGIEHLAEIAAVEAAPLGLTELQCIDYLRDNLHYRLGPEARRGLELYYQYADRLGLVPGREESQCAPAGDASIRFE